MIPEGDVRETPAVRREPVAVTVSSKGIGSPLTVTIVDSKGRVGQAETALVLTPAEKQPVSFESLAKAVGELGGTPFSLGELDARQVDFSANAFIPASAIKSCRREAVERLAVLRAASGSGATMGVSETPVAAEMLEAASRAWWGHREDAPSASLNPLKTDDELRNVQSLETRSTAGNVSETRSSSMLSILCRTREQAEAALLVPWLEEITLDFLEVHGLRDAVLAVKASGRLCAVATPRVLKPDEEKLWRFYLSLDADALLVRSAGLMRTFAAMSTKEREGAASAEAKARGVPRLRGDFSLNAANAVGAALLLSAGNLQRLTPTHDLDAKQQAALARALGGEGARRLDVVIHQHLPIFHTEHCVFCRFLSDGNSYKDCGHPCETSALHLRDAESKDHLVLADMGCRNTVFNAQAQSGAEYVSDLLDAGVRHFRIELVDEPGAVVGELLEAYREVLAGDRRGSEVVRWVGTLPDANGNAHGAGRGSLEARKEKDRGTMKQTAAAKNAAQRQAAKGR
jgi:hypothetical protein